MSDALIFVALFNALLESLKQSSEVAEILKKAHEEGRTVTKEEVDSLEVKVEAASGKARAAIQAAREKLEVNE